MRLDCGMARTVGSALGFDKGEEKLKRACSGRSWSEDLRAVRTFFFVCVRYVRGKIRYPGDYDDRLRVHGKITKEA